jgi:hypothetical protein
MILDRKVAEYLDCVEQRDRIQERKEAGEAWPCTENEILKHNRFTCNRREDDATSRWVRAWLKPHYDNPEIGLMAAALVATMTDDPRRQRPIKLHWQGRIGRLYIDGVLWGEVEWSDKRKVWCVQDAQGRCLSHKSHIHGQDAAKEAAVALAEAMIRDGRMPTPEEANKARKDRLARDRARRANTPSGNRRLAERAERERLWTAHMDAHRADEQAPPLHEVLAEAFDLSDPNLWRSNSFAMLRPRMIISVRRTIAELECELRCDDGRWRRKERFAKARELLALLETRS